MQLKLVAVLYGSSVEFEINTAACIAEPTCHHHTTATGDQVLSTCDAIFADSSESRKRRQRTVAVRVVSMSGDALLELSSEEVMEWNVGRLKQRLAVPHQRAKLILHSEELEDIKSLSELLVESDREILQISLVVLPAKHVVRMPTPPCDDLVDEDVDERRTFVTEDTADQRETFNGSES